MLKALGQTLAHQRPSPCPTITTNSYCGPKSAPPSEHFNVLFLLLPPPAPLPVVAHTRGLKTGSQEALKITNQILRSTYKGEHWSICHFKLIWWKGTGRHHGNVTAVTSVGGKYIYFFTIKFKEENFIVRDVIKMYIYI